MNIQMNSRKKGFSYKKEYFKMKKTHRILENFKQLYHEADKDNDENQN